MKPNTANLDRLLNPRSIAVLGASNSTEKLGGVPIRIMQAYGYPGRLHPINPKGGDILGLPANRDITEVEGEIDLAILAIPAAGVIGALEACAARAVKGAVIFSSGFAETGGEGHAAQARLADIAKTAGMRIVGPNSLGVVNIAAGVAATFCPFFLPRMDVGGSIGLVSQSGAFGGYVANLAAERGLSFSSWITTGNEADVDLCDAIAYQAGHHATKVILVYMEGVRDGAKLAAALDMAHAARKPVIVLKVGRTGEGAAAAASHTGSLAGSDEVYDAVFRQYGAYRAHSIAEWFSLGYSYSVGKPPANRDIGIVTVSGGVGVMMADEAVSGGLTPAPLSEAAQNKIKALVPFAGTRNPVDMTGRMIAELSTFGEMVDIVLADRNFGSFISFNAGAAITEEKGFAIQRVWAMVREQHPDTHIAVTGSMHASVRRAFEEIGCLTFMEPDMAVRVACAMRDVEDALDKPRGTRPATAARQELPAGTLNEVQSMQVLELAGIPVLSPRLAQSAVEAVAHADAFGYPVVLKVVSADILHKSDIGGVALSLTDADAVRAAFARCMEAARFNAPQARLDGCLVSPMMEHDGVETILGVNIDEVFGPVVMFGLGGVFVEVMKDVTFRVAPFGREEAFSMIDEIRSRAVLDGARGKPETDIDALANTLVSLSAFAHAHAERLVSIDINPFVVDANGRGARALDAVVVTK